MFLRAVTVTAYINRDLTEAVQETINIHVYITACIGEEDKHEMSVYDFHHGKAHIGRRSTAESSHRM